MNTTLLLHHVIGAINLTLPIIIAFYVFPSLKKNVLGQIACACLIGSLIFYIQYTSTKNKEKSLLYTASGECKKNLDEHIRACNIDPKNVNIKYAYTAGQLGLSMFNTIVVDPTLCSNLQDDPEAAKVQSIYDNAIAPQLPEQDKARLSQIKEIFSPQAQSFILKHELGHTHNNYSHKKLIIGGVLTVAATFAGISSGLFALPTLGTIAAIGIGMFVGGSADVVLGYSSNFLFTAQEEKYADIFAAQHSSPEEIHAAADFFEQHQTIVKDYKKSMGLLGKLPSTVLTGHPENEVRVAYLRTLATEKTRTA